MTEKTHFYGDDCQPPHEKYTKLPDGRTLILPCGSSWGMGVTTLHGEDAEEFGGSIYGHGPSAAAIAAGFDPNDFEPDEECCTPEELAAWRQAKACR